MSYLEILEITLFREKSLKPFNIVNLEGIEYVSVSFGEGSEKKWIKILAKKKNQNRNIFNKDLNEEKKMELKE